MSVDIVKQIIARAVTELEFREQLLSDSAKALEGYELTEEERAALQGLTPQEFDALGGELEERVSRAGLMGARLRPTSGSTCGPDCGI